SATRARPSRCLTHADDLIDFLWREPEAARHQLNEFDRRRPAHLIPSAWFVANSDDCAEGSDMTLSLAEANSVVNGAIAKARQLNTNISVAVCDPAGNLIALNRMDGAYATASRLSKPPRFRLEGVPKSGFHVEPGHGVSSVRQRAQVGRVP